MIKLPSEQPPVLDNPRLAEWLARNNQQVNAALDSIDDMELTGQMPNRVFNGMRRYFSVAIAPDITVPGAWIYQEGAWAQMTGTGAASATPLVNKITVSTTRTILDSELFDTKINIILVDTDGITITLSASASDKLVWFQKIGAITYTVVVP
jgi:hypothetical protein